MTSTCTQNVNEDHAICARVDGDEREKNTKTREMSSNPCSLKHRFPSILLRRRRRHEEKRGRKKTFLAGKCYFCVARACVMVTPQRAAILYRGYRGILGCQTAVVKTDIYSTMGIHCPHI